MRKLIMWNVVTVDGCFEGERPWDLSFHELVWGKELEEFSRKQLDTVELLIFGENTYRGMAEYWSKADGEDQEITHKMNTIPKIVCSPTLEKAEWNNTTIARDAVTEILNLKAAGEGNMLVFGSGNLSESLVNAGLFDEYRLVIAPVILGKGRLLFPDQVQYQQLRFLEAIPLATGGMIVRYAPQAATR